MERRHLIYAIRVIALIIVACVVYVFAGNLLDRWIPHTRDTPIWIEGDWLVGEVRDCYMETTTPPVQGMTYSREYLQSLPRMFCDSASEGILNFYESLPESGRDDAFDQAFKRQSHLMKVTYRGRLDRPEKFRLDWRCTRDTDSISCKATN